jgi:pyruvate ferredoxin oxidoreductase gamma subunit
VCIRSIHEACADALLKWNHQDSAEWPLPSGEIPENCGKSFGHIPVTRFLSQSASPTGTHVALEFSRVTPMIEIRIDGRGGQGNVVAAYMLAEAGFEAGCDVQAFPSFGPERRGAPVAAFVRISDQPIKRRNQIREPQFVIVQDPSLMHSAGIAAGVRKGGGILVNSARPIQASAIPPQVKVLALPASAMAVEALGQPIPNTALLAAFLALTDLFPLIALEKALARRFAGDSLKRNLQLMRAAAGRVPAGAWKEGARASGN